MNPSKSNKDTIHKSSQVYFITGGTICQYFTLFIFYKSKEFKEVESSSDIKSWFIFKITQYNQYLYH